MIKAVLVPSKLKTGAACMLAVWLISEFRRRFRHPKLNDYKISGIEKRQIENLAEVYF